MTETYVAFYEPGERWQPGKSISEQPLDDHVKYLRSLHERGKLLMGGPIANEPSGLVVLDVSGRDEALCLIESDPAVVDMVLTAKVLKWNRVV